MKKELLQNTVDAQDMDETLVVSVVYHALSRYFATAPCAGARLCQQTLSLGTECASPGGFLLYRTRFPINLHAPTSSHTTINEKSQ